MKFEPFMWATFCDDVRQEVGNKLSFLGIYGPNLVVPSLPTTLVKLCCIMSLRVPDESPPKQVIFRLIRDEEVLYETDLSPADFQTPAVRSADNGTDQVVLTVTTIAQLLSFKVTQRCFLKTRAIVDGKELRGGALELTSADEFRVL